MFLLNSGLFFLIITIILLQFVIVLFKMYFLFKKYKNSSYQKISRNSFGEIIFNKGIRGEFLVYNILEKIPEFDGMVLTNLYIPRGDGKTTEIDIVALHTTGIYVFEIKNYSGRIYGSCDDKYWVQILAKEKNKFYNPIRQNYNHIKTLRNYLNLTEEKFVSIICFAGNSDIRNVMGGNVIKIEDLKKYIGQYLVSRYLEKGNILTKEEINKTYLNLIELSKIDKATKDKHIEEIKRLKKEADKNDRTL